MKTNKITFSVEWILKKFEKHEIKYAVLRNYENLPKIGNDLDLIADSDKLNEIKLIFQECKSKFGWEYFVQINKWKSYVNDFSIYVFKFFCFRTNCILHIDIFGGYSIWSAPAISQTSFLKDRFKYRGFYIISPKHEVIIRSMQLACSIRDGESNRIKKLKNKIKLLGNTDFVLKSFNSLYVKLNPKFINQKDLLYYKEFSKFKKKYFMISFLKNPIRLIARFLERIRFRFMLYSFSIPGFILFVNKETFNSSIEKNISELNSLKKNRIIKNYNYSNIFNLKNLYAGYKSMISGGILFILSPLHKSRFNINLVKEKIIKNI